MVQGAHDSLRPALWPVLLGLHAPEASAAERTAQWAELSTSFETLQQHCAELEIKVEEYRAAAADGAAASLSSAASSSRSVLPSQLAAFAEAHRIIVMDAIRTNFRPPPAADADSFRGWLNGKLSVLRETGEVGLKKLTTTVATSFSGAPIDLAAAPARVSSADGVASAASDAAAGSDSSAAADGNQATGATLAAAAAVEASTAVAAAPPSPPLASDDDPAADYDSVGWSDGYWLSAQARDVLEGASHMSGGDRRQALRLIVLLTAYAVHDPQTGYCQG